MTCTCGSDTAFETCCGSILDGSRDAPTAEALMRARYSAYATGQIGFIAKSHIPSHRHEVDQESSRQWSRGAEWRGLDIHAIEGGGTEDGEGAVDFTARYRVNEQDIEHREIATFKKQDGIWYFVDGEAPKQEPFRREDPKVGPNVTCPCGSGKKFKKCCGVK